MNDNQAIKYTDQYMILFEQAIECVFENTEVVDVESISYANSKGRVLGSDILSPADVPSFNNSAMDGYSVNAQDLNGASMNNPVELELAGLTAAGDFDNTITNTQGKAWKIMTGAPVPDAFDSIIPVENTKLEDDRVFCYSSPEQGAHVRLKGQDFRIGDAILTKGRIVNANGIMACAALGVDQIDVYKKPKITVFSTGKELIDDPSTPLKPGQIRNSNKPFIENWLSNLPVDIHDAGTNSDQVDAFEKDLLLELDKGTDIVISTGAVSMGDFDFIPQTIIKLGGEIIFHKTKIRPGKPILFAKFPNGSLYFGLPGNPISAAIGLRFFVSAAIRKMLGLARELPVQSKLTNEVNKKLGFRAVLKAKSEIGQDASHRSFVLEGQQSFKIHSLLNASGWVVIDEQSDNVKPETKVDFYPSSLIWE